MYMDVKRRSHPHNLLYCVLYFSYSRSYIQPHDGYISIVEIFSCFYMLDCNSASVFMYVSLKDNADGLSKKCLKTPNSYFCFVELRSKNKLHVCKIILIFTETHSNKISRPYSSQQWETLPEILDFPSRLTEFHALWDFKDTFDTYLCIPLLEIHLYSFVFHILKEPNQLEDNMRNSFTI
jgi:hypothetical protein